MAQHRKRRTLSETKRLVGEMRRDARAIAEEKPDISAPDTFKFHDLEDQTNHALNTLQILELTLMEGNNTMALTDEDLSAMAGLLFSARLFLEPLDLRGVAAALHFGDFSMVRKNGSGRPTIACAKCSQEKQGIVKKTKEA